MFYNHADETERRKRRSVQLEARGLDIGHSFRSAGTLGQEDSSSSPKPVPGHARRSSSALRAVDTAVFSTCDNGAAVSSSHNRSVSLHKTQVIVRPGQLVTVDPREAEGATIPLLCRSKYTAIYLQSPRARIPEIRNTRREYISSSALGSRRS